MKHPVEHPGLYPDLSLLYHNEQLTPTRHLSQSGIKVIVQQTPFDYINPTERTSDEMDFGSVVHSLALGKLQRFAVSPYDDYRTKEARQWKADMAADNMIPIKSDKFREAATIADLIQSKLAALLGAEYETELPFFWTEDDTWCGGMMDVWCPSRLTCIDVKVTSAVHNPASKMASFGWDIQSAWTQRGLNAILPEHSGRIRFANLLIKPEAPFTSRVVMLNEAWRHSAEMECLRGLRIFQECMRTGNWPGYPDSIEMLDAPAWMLAQRMQAEMESEE